MPIYFLREKLSIRFPASSTDVGVVTKYSDQKVDLSQLLVKKTFLWKRMMDISISLFGLFLLLPLLIIIAIYIKIVSPGPIFFKQERVGKGGRIFPCYKFRTMRPNSDPSRHKEYLATLIHGNPSESIKDIQSSTETKLKMTKLRSDSRIIPFGNILRETGLDELPQLFNVLLGDMSLVGPRPSIPYEVEEFQQWHKDRFDALPGITGLWQISGKNRLTFNEMIRLDITYCRRINFWLDVKIILLTPYAVFIQLIDYLQTLKHP